MAAAAGGAAAPSPRDVDAYFEAARVFCALEVGSSP
jgi:hypothetical protein